MDPFAAERAQRAIAALSSSKLSASSMMTKRLDVNREPCPTPSCKRLDASLHDRPYDLNNLEQIKRKKETVLYLAYGSNLSNETFRGSRGIKPLSQINVQVPSLRLTFDLPGVPYIEPCFANTGRRDPENDPPKDGAAYTNHEKAPLLTRGMRQKEYRKNRWHKGLIGVVYEVTPEDYAHVIATEGGGSSYQDILVDCHPFANSDPYAPVPQNPTLLPFKAHTLFAPALEPGEQPPDHGGRLQRPDISYAQASARYLKLITDGATELGLPFEYQEYLQSLRPYTMTTRKQKAGQIAFLALWGPILALLFSLIKLFADERGRLPDWMKNLSTVVFTGIWRSYDTLYKPIYGDGERTLGDRQDTAEGDLRPGATGRMRLKPDAGAAAEKLEDMV